MLIRCLCSRVVVVDDEDEDVVSVELMYVIGDELIMLLMRSSF